jgi:hypothetical protein
MHAYRSANGASRTKLLYLFRSPAHVAMGRKTLDPEVREALEHTHPDLNFDWNGLLRESPVPQRQPRVDPRERPKGRGADRDRSGRGQDSRGPRATQAPASMPDVPQDDTVLGQAIGAREAARVRQKYAELRVRIERRSRTPEERTRLLTTLEALSPESWSSPEAARAEVAGYFNQWEALAAELPRRRRGRRGGRSEDGAEVDDPGQNEAADVIIEDRDDTDGQEIDLRVAAIAGAVDRDGGGTTDITDAPGDPGPDDADPATDVRQPG